MMLVLVAIALAASSGAPGLFLRRDSAVGERLAAAAMVASGALGIAGALSGVASGGEVLHVGWAVPGGAFSVAVDALSSMFLLPIFLVSALGSVYGLSYWRQADHPENGRKLRFFYGFIPAGMALLVVARHALVFLLGWEAMALGAFFTITTEDHDPTIRRTGLLYFFCTRVSTLLLFAMFALLRREAGTFEFVALGEGAAATGAATAIFLLALGGFGLKAGMMPLHVWLPSAHAGAPSHVSALMSGVLIKMGIYGIVRVLTLLPTPPAWWGAAILVLGIASGVLGVAFAIGQHDLKRLLAYHSIENIGIILMGLGLATLGRSFGRADLVVLGLAGALLHVWNHGLFKSLLFLSAGAVIHAAHTREIDELGGLARTMPRTAFFFLAGAVAICGLPPMNGFVSELLVYLGFLRSVADGGERLWLGAAFAAPALALVGALALACFAKVFGAVFLGTARSEHGRDARDPGPWMSVPMALLFACCAAIGCAPVLVAGVLERSIADWDPVGRSGPSLLALAPFGWVSAGAALLLALVAAGGVLLRYRLRAGPVGSAVTWDCGYAAPRSSMQYTASSFARTLVGLFSWALRPQVHEPRIESLFPRASSFRSHVPDAVLDGLVLPVASALGRFSAWCRWFQRGSLHAYLFYILVTVIVLLLWPS